MLSKIKERRRIKTVIKSSDKAKSMYLPDGVEGIDDYLFTIESHGRGYINGIYRDGNNSLTLYREIPGNAEALVGFKKINLETIMVVQLQARKGAQKEDLPKRWEKILLEAGINYAKKHGFLQIRVLPSKRNTWIRHNDNDQNLRLKIRYDITAKRRGFKFDETVDAWVLDL